MIDYHRFIGENEDWQCAEEIVYQNGLKMKYDIFCLPIIAICVVVNLQLAASAAVNHQPFVSEKV